MLLHMSVACALLLGNIPLYGRAPGSLSIHLLSHIFGDYE